MTEEEYYHAQIKLDCRKQCMKLEAVFIVSDTSNVLAAPCWTYTFECGQFSSAPTQCIGGDIQARQQVRVCAEAYK